MGDFFEVFSFNIVTLNFSSIEASIVKNIKLLRCMLSDPYLISFLIFSSYQKIFDHIFRNINHKNDVCQKKQKNCVVVFNLRNAFVAVLNIYTTHMRSPNPGKPLS